MPGGFCRVAHAPDSRAFTMGDNVSSADVWIAGDRPVEMSTLLPATDSVRVIRLLGNLPSRAADNLFWLGRYLERAEATCLLARCLSPARWSSTVRATAPSPPWTCCAGS